MESAAPSWCKTLWIANGRRTVRRQCLVQHLDQLLRASRRLDPQTCQRTQQRNIVQPMMRGAISPHTPRPVNCEHHRQTLKAHVMLNLVDRPLQKRRIDRHNRPQSSLGQSSGKRHRHLLADTDIKETVREGLGEFRKPRAAPHRRNHRTHAVILIRRLDHRRTKDIAPRLRHRPRNGRPRRGAVRMLKIERTNTVPIRWIGLGRRKTPPLFRHNMHDNGTLLLLSRRQGRDDRRQVMAIHRPHGAKPKRLKRSKVLQSGCRIVVHHHNHLVRQRQALVQGL